MCRKPTHRQYEWDNTICAFTLYTLCVYPSQLNHMTFIERNNNDLTKIQRKIMWIVNVSVNFILFRITLLSCKVIYHIYSSSHIHRFKEFLNIKMRGGAKIIQVKTFACSFRFTLFKCLLGALRTTEYQQNSRARKLLHT